MKGGGGLLNWYWACEGGGKRLSKRDNEFDIIGILSCTEKGKCCSRSRGSRRVWHILGNWQMSERASGNFHVQNTNFEDFFFAKRVLNIYSSLYLASLLRSN